ncbi:MAG: T9SS type A sorting domain-containing protein, partial [Bacteroidota bacterium]
MLYTLNMLNSNLAYQLQGINYAAALSIPIKYLEFGNEHNLSCDPISSTTYASMSKTWADTIKAHYPATKICLVGGDIPSSAPNWISDISSQSINYDALSFHVYPLPSPSSFNVRNALSIAYNTTGQRYSNSHFSNVQSKEVWVTEYNMSSGNTALTNTWSQSLFILAMMDTLIQKNQVTMMLPWAYSGPNAYFQSLDYNNFTMKATGVSVKLINDVSRNLDSCKKINFTPNQYQTYNGTTYPKIFGYKFYNAISSKAMMVNISSTNYNLDISTLGIISSFKKYSADTAQIISNGFQSLNVSSGTSNIINMPPFSVVIVDFTQSTGKMDLLTNKDHIEVYPNPVNNSLKLKNIDANTNCKVYDSKGQLALEIIYNGISIDVSLLDAGIYFIVLTDNKKNSQLHAKFIKK